MIHTYEDLLPAMRNIVAEAGEDFVYVQKSRTPGGMEGCEYAYNGKPDCGIGHLLHKLGVPVADMGADGYINASQIDSYYSTLKTRYGLSFDWAAKVLMQEFQLEQDNGTPWGGALEAAINAAEGKTS